MKDTKVLEQVQHGITRWNPYLKRLPYEKRLEVLNLPDIESRQNRADLIQLFRLTHNLFPTNHNEFLQLAADERLRGHPYKLQKEPFKSTVPKHFLTNRSFEMCNKLPLNTVESDSLFIQKKN